MEVGDVERVLGRIRGRRPGPTVLGVGGIHGNEPAGILALRRVLESLDGRQESVFGEFVAFAGNRAALKQGCRYLSRDLNRAWAPSLDGAPGPAPSAAGTPATTPEACVGEAQESIGEGPEGREQLELLTALDGAIEDSRGPVFLLDLHTTSGPGGPFSTIMDSLSSRWFASKIPVPLIVGLGELVEGTLLGYMADRGVPGVVFEGGQRSDPSSVAISEAGIWLTLAGAGIIRESMFPEVGLGRRLLMAASRGLPPVMELKHRHPVSRGDGFRMMPDFRSFQRVRAGDVLARDQEGPVRSPEDGRLLMPLYQPQGDDGFFLVREFHPFWLTVSEILRRLRIGQALHWLPGIRRDPQGPHRLRVDRRLARWRTLEILHLLGYRKTLEDGDWLIVVRQREARSRT